MEKRGYIAVNGTETEHFQLVATMVAPGNGMVLDHSASSPPAESVPMPEAQRDLIAEAMKVQMKQGQV